LATSSPHLVVNLRTRRLAAGGPLLDTVRAAARDTCILHETRSLAELDAAVAEIAAARPDVVVLAGGDGSYMAGLTALMRAYGSQRLPRIALAPCGTVSTVVRNYGFSGPAAPYVARIVSSAARGGARTTPAPTLRVTDEKGVTRVGFIFGAGLVARFFERYEAAGARGYGGAARIVARIFASSFVGGATARHVLTPGPATLTLDGVTAPARAYSLILASTVRDVGLGMRVTPRAGEDPARVQVVASPLGPRALGPQMPLVLLGRRLRGRHHVDALARVTTVDFGAAPAPFIVDGDLFEGTKLTLEAGPLLDLIIA
jgi:diacylglycerol kinase (ATP)